MKKLKIAEIEISPADAKRIGLTPECVQDFNFNPRELETAVSALRDTRDFVEGHIAKDVRDNVVSRSDALMSLAVANRTFKIAERCVQATWLMCRAVTDEEESA